MKLNLLFAATAIFILFSCNNKQVSIENETFKPPVSYQEASAWADSILQLMTFEEKTEYIGGVDIFYIKAIERLGIPRVYMADATMGVNLRHEFLGVTYDNAIDTSTAFPASLVLASTWNPELSYKYAHSVGEECKANGIGILLGPGFNIYRISQSGRNFEYFGEDPYLISRMIEKYVLGVQNTGTIATLKHFVCNNTDYIRRKSNSIVDERTLNEIYLPAFKAGIDAGAMAVMSSYNLFRGEWTGESKYLLTDVLRQQLGFKWLVMTDWWSIYNGEKAMTSGLDIEMPKLDALESADSLIQQGVVDEAKLNRMVKSILTTCKAMQLYEKKPHPELLNTFREHEKVAIQTAREGIVLTKNNGILPLDKNVQNIVVTGDFVTTIAKGGGASAVDGYGHVSLLKALTDAFGGKINYLPNPTNNELKNADMVILNVGIIDSEAWDRPFDLPKAKTDSITQIIAQNKNTVVVVNAGSAFNMTNWYDSAAAVILAFYPGQVGNIAIAEVIDGKVNPSGKLPFTWEKQFADGVDPDYIPEGMPFYSGWNEEHQIQQGSEIYDVNYDEGVFVGYRWYEHKNIEPLIPFGHGLSYTRFEYTDIKLSSTQISAGENIQVSCTLTNAGEQEGAEIVQVYVSDKECSLVRPNKELKGFKKVWLQPGESKTVTIIISADAFKFWSPELKSWTVEPGEFEIMVGASSAQIKLKQSLVLK